MTDRTIILAENNRTTTRGVRQETEREFYAYQLDGEDLSYVIDFTGLLGSATISSVTRTADGLTVAGASNTTTSATQRLSDFGHVDIAVTASDSQVHIVRLHIRPRRETVRANDYGFVG